MKFIIFVCMFFCLVPVMGRTQEVDRAESCCITGVVAATVLRADNEALLRFPGLISGKDLGNTALEEKTIALLKNRIDERALSSYVVLDAKDRHNAALLMPHDAKIDAIVTSFLRAGLVVLYVPEKEDLSIPSGWRNAEREAETKHQGLWADIPLLAADTILEDYRQYLGRFVVVEGTISSVYTTRARIFLNFGHDWKTDFTLTLPAEYQKRFGLGGKEGEVEAWKGRKVRVRGWLENYNGPAIRLTHPAQWEIVGTLHKQ